MRRTDFESLGDRQKAFESLEAARKLMPGVPVLVRLDGRAFHTFTRGLARPFDARLSRAMIETTKFLVQETHAAIGYCQSDEISLAFPNGDPAKAMLFDGRVQKLCSILASLATAKFNQLVAASIPEKAHLLPVFDARAWGLPDLDVAAEHFIWREADATRNSLTMAAHAHYSHKELHKAGFTKKHDLLHAKGVNWNDYPAFFKRGTYVRRETELRELCAQELARIPEKHRPTEPVMRSVVRELAMPPVTRVANLREVLFFGAEPVEATQSASSDVDVAESVQSC
jgi:tRNA(His) 5'-end guanylyltransferase